MNFKKPKFWAKKNIISFFFFPLSIFTYVTNSIKKIYPKKKFNIKTICIGNIYLGGTGKTSLAIEINKILKKKFKTVFIKKKYYNQKDEINLLNNINKVISTKNRLKSLELSEKNKFEIAILDDGLQQKNISYNLKIVCFNTKDSLGNGLLLPAGPLRENLNEIKAAILNIEGEYIPSSLDSLSKLSSLPFDIWISKVLIKIHHFNAKGDKKTYLIINQSSWGC